MKRGIVRAGITAILLFAIIAMATTPVQANTRVYSTGWVIIDWFHVGLVYDVPYNSGYHPFIGGVDQATVNKYVSSDHLNVQKWDWRSYKSGKSVLLVPKTYILYRWNFASEIYLEFLSGQVQNIIKG